MYWLGDLCVLSLLLFTLQNNDCAVMHSSNHITKFIDDWTVVRLISGNNGTANREGVQLITDWYRTNCPLMWIKLKR